MRVYVFHSLMASIRSILLSRLVVRLRAVCLTHPSLSLRACVCVCVCRVRDEVQ